VVRDPQAPYYGIQVSERALVPDGGARLGATRFEDWLNHAVKDATKDATKQATKAALSA
jgi:hypothetical protein